MTDSKDNTDRRFPPAGIMTPERIERMRELWAATPSSPADHAARLAEIERRLEALEHDQDLMHSKLEVLRALVLDLVKVLVELRAAVCGEEDGGSDG